MRWRRRSASDFGGGRSCCGGRARKSIAARVVGASARRRRIVAADNDRRPLRHRQTRELMVSGDTGPLHIAAAVGTPVVALFGPTHPERNGPWVE